MAAPTIHLTHSPRLVRGDGQAMLLNEKDAALLALAVLEGPIARTRVAALLWPAGDGAPGDQASGGSADKRALNNLRQRLFRLTRFAGHELLTAGPTIALVEGVAHDLDVTAERFAADARSAPGDLLGGYRYDDESELARWLEAARQRWRAARADALMALATRLDGENRIDDALPLATRLVGDEPLMEHASRLLMRLHYRRDDRGAALAEFERLRAALYEQTGDAPSDETIRLSLAIVRADAPAPAKRLALPLALRHPPATVGRETAALRAEHRWEQFGVVLLLGAAGIGKTRLTNDLVQRWGIDVRVLCRPESAASTFGLVGALATALAPGVRARLGSEDQAWLDWLADPFRRASPLPAVQQPQVQQRLAGILSAAAAGGVLAIALEDLHHADAASLAMLCTLIAASGNTLRWLLSCRDNELPAPLQAWIESRSLGADPVVRLEPLNVEATQRFLGSLDIADSRPDAAAQLHAHCGGHPLFMLQVLRQLQLAGELDGGRWPARLPLPDDAMVAASQRLTRADAATQQMAFLAALCGPDFSADLMCRLMRCSAVDLLAPWRRLEDLHIFGAQGFSHDLVREAVLAVVPQALAPLLHREIAQALQVQQGDPLRRARHWRAGGDAAQAAAAFEEAAAVAQRCGLLNEAIASLDAAREQHLLAGRPDAAFEADWRRGHWMVGAASLEQGAALAQRLAAVAQGRRQQALAHELAALVKVEQHDEGALDEARAAFELTATLDEPTLAERCRLRLAESLAGARRYDEALTTLDAGDPGSLAADQRHVHASSRASILASLGRRYEAVAVQRDWLDQALAARNLAQASCSAGFCSTHLAYLCRLGDAVTLAEQSIALAREAGIEQGLMLVDEMGLAGNLGDLGRFAEALEIGERVIGALRAAGHSVWAINASNDRAVILMRLGRIDLALQLLRSPIDDEAPPWVRAARKMVLARIQQWQGLDSSATMTEAVALFDTLGLAEHDYPRQKITLEAACARGGNETIAQAERCIAWALEHEHVALERYARMVAIEAFGKAGRRDAAAAQARALAVQPGVTSDAFGYYLPQLLMTAAQALDAVGDRSGARPLWQAARAWVQRSSAQHVPALFRDSFLERNPVNRALLALPSDAATVTAR